MQKEYITWNEEKNQILQETRGISFEAIMVAIEQGGVLDDIAHPNNIDYPNQRLLVVCMDDYVYHVPYVVNGEKYFFKTIFPSRKSKKLYLNS